MTWKLGEPAPAQINPAELSKDDSWTWTCGICFLCTQGGRGGLGTHMNTVHADEQRRKPFTRRTP